MSHAARISATRSAPESGDLLLQRKCACGAQASGLTDQCDECATRRMLGLQTKLTVSEPGDRYEQEADRVAEEVMRMPAPGIHRQTASGEDEDEESLQLQPMNLGTSIQRQAEEDEDEEELLQAKELPGHTPAVTPMVSNRINAMRGAGSPLPESARAFYEPRFGVDFGKTRIHTGALAADTARALNARAFTLGRDIFFNAGEFQPASARGKRLLAHELTHVVQQAGGRPRLSPSSRDGVAHRPGLAAVNAARGASPSRMISPARPALMRLSPERFRKRLGRTPGQRTVIDALFEHPTFKTLWGWIGRCKGKRADHGPIKLRVGRVFSDDKQTVGPGIPAFGVFNETRGILKINPNYREAGKRVARENPQELADTLVHELVHAASWALRTGKCPGQGNPPLEAGGLVDEDERRLVEPKEPGYKPTERLPLGEELNRFERLGPSASDPCNYFLDIEAAPQNEIVEITDDIRQQTHTGGPTRTRVNQILRDEIRAARRGKSPEATLAAAPLLRGFMRCRDEECAKRRRRRNIARCFDEVLTNEQGVASQTGQESAADADLADGSASGAPSGGPSIQRKREASADAAPLPKSTGDEDRLPRATHAPELTRAVTTDVSRRIDAMRGGGTPMAASERAFFEPRFGADFSGTRIHTGQPAAEAARTLKARAFTLGKEIYFGAGEYQPASARGGRLLAHELAHIVQQNGNGAAIGRANRAGAGYSLIATPNIQRRPKSGPTEEEEQKQEKRPTGFLGWWLRVRVPKGLKPTKRRARRANTLLDRADAGEIKLESDEKTQLQKLAGDASTKKRSGGKKSIAAGKSGGAESTDADVLDAEAQSGGTAKAIKVPTLIKGAAVDNPDSLEWRHFKSTDAKPKIGKKEVIAATDVKPVFAQGTFIADFEKTSAVWSHVEPFDKPVHWIDPTCKPLLSRCNTAVDKLGKDLSRVERFPSGFSWNADIICAEVDAESGTADREVKSRADCKRLFTQCSAANPIAHKDQLLCHERGHLWINALASERANEHLAAGKPQPAVAAELGKRISELTASYELETEHACPTLGKTRCWDGAAVRKQVDAAWAKPAQDG